MNKIRCTYTLAPDIRTRLKELSLATRIPASSLVEEALQDLLHKYQQPKLLSTEPRKEDLL